jgi:tetratricopeptide (TPR) repeat protein
LSLIAALPGAGRAETMMDTAIRLAEEQERLSQLRQRLTIAESEDSQANGVLQRLQKGLDAQSLSQLPERVTSEDLEVKRSLGGNGLVYDITCSRTPVVQVLEAIRETSGLTLEIHPDTGRNALLGDVSLNLRGEDLADTLQIICGTQGLGAALGERRILVAPLSALAPVPVEKILREMAVEDYQAALLRYPASDMAPRAYLGVARYYAMSGFEETAIEATQRLLQNSPRSDAAGPAMILLADSLASLRRLEEARASYYRYVDNYPGASDLPAVLMKIGKTWMDERKWDQAIPVFESVFREWRDSDEAPYARMRLAECLTNLQQHEKALEQLQVLERKSRQFSSEFEIKFVLGECLMNLKRYGSARVYFKQVAETSNDALLAERASYALGDTFLAESSPLAAVEAYRSAMRSFPAGPLRRTAPLRLARACLQMGLCERAEDHLRAIAGTGVDPREARSVVIELAQYHLNIGDAERALALLGQLPDRDASADTRLLKGEAELLMGRTPQALANAEAAIRLSPDDEPLRSKAIQLAGRCHEEMGKPALAALAYGGAQQ